MMFSWITNSWKKLLVTVIASVVTGALVKAGVKPETVQQIVNLITLAILGQGAADAGKTAHLLEKGLASPPAWLKYVYLCIAGLIPVLGPIVGLSADLCKLLAELFAGLGGAQALADWKMSKAKIF
jgi:hypothetical protein